MIMYKGKILYLFSQPIKWDDEPEMTIEQQRIIEIEMGVEFE